MFVLGVKQGMFVIGEKQGMLFLDKNIVCWLTLNVFLGK